MRLKSAFTKIISVTLFFFTFVTFANGSESILESCEYYLEHRHKETLKKLKSETTCKKYLRAIAELISTLCSINDPNMISVRFKNKDLISPTIEEIDSLIYPFVLQLSMFGNSEEVPEAAIAMAFIAGASDQCPN